VKPCDARGRSRDRAAVAKTLIRASVQQLGFKRAGHICACDRAALMRFRFWVFRPDKAAFENMLQHLRRIIAGFDLLIMENFYFNRVGETTCDVVLNWLSLQVFCSVLAP
jgi:hypothetical protein